PVDAGAHAGEPSRGTAGAGMEQGTAPLLPGPGPAALNDGGVRRKLLVSHCVTRPCRGHGRGSVGLECAGASGSPTSFEYLWAGPGFGRSGFRVVRLQRELASNSRLGLEEEAASQA
ncbi:unnamed protein product, partial [Prorocentrum cordatum]